MGSKADRPSQGAVNQLPAPDVPEDLAARAARASDVRELAEVVVDWLEVQGLPLPSVYLERAGRLRCLAVRGYWQILDGFTTESGVLAETVRTGTAQLIPDVRLQPDYIAAVPGVLAELCLPLRHGDRVVGGLNLELTRVLRDEDVAVTRFAAEVFERRLAELGGPEPESPWQILAHRSAQLASLTDHDEIADYAVSTACELTGFESAVLVVERAGEHRVEAACGPLADALHELPPEALPAIASWTGAATTAYTVGKIAGSGFPGHQALRDIGVSALLSATLPSQGERHGFLLAVSRQPGEPAHDVAQHLEILAAHAASSLHTAVAFAKARERAAQDSLTGLGHGATFQEDLGAILHRQEEPVGVLLIDLDHFKQVNDTRGHLYGDEVLVDAAALMAGMLRGTDRLYRLGGDEFAAIVRVETLAEAEGIASRVAAAMRKSAPTTVSIGCAMVDPGDDLDPDGVLARADLALYETKRNGRDGVTAYRAELRAAVLDRAKLAADLATAIAKGDLTLAFQPIMDLSGAGVIGVEALARWEHPTRGPIPPSVFIPLAEEDGLVGDIGRWVLDESCRQLAEWDAAGWARGDLRVGFNVSADELGPDLVDQVRDALLRHGVAANRLVVEVTESVFVDTQRAIGPLRALRDLGVHVARLPAAAAGRHPQDRPLVRRRPGEPAQPGRRPGDPPARQRPRDVHGRRGDRGGRAARRAAGARLRARAGLLLVPAGRRDRARRGLPPPRPAGGGTGGVSGEGLADAAPPGHTERSAPAVGPGRPRGRPVHMPELNAPGTLEVPVVDHPPADARIGDVVYRRDHEEFAVNTVFGWVACRPARVPTSA